MNSQGADQLLDVEMRLSDKFVAVSEMVGYAYSNGLVVNVRCDDESEDGSSDKAQSVSISMNNEDLVSIKSNCGSVAKDQICNLDIQIKDCIRNSGDVSYDPDDYLDMLSSNNVAYKRMDGMISARVVVTCPLYHKLLKWVDALYSAHKTEYGQ